MTQTASPDLIHTPFGFDSTAAEVIEGISLDNKHAIVTGASSGIGVETARALASAGAEVTLAVRDTQAGDRTASDISATTGRAVHVGRLDLADQASVAEFAAGWSGPLHLLINNAGVMALQELTLTPDGWELQFATNHLGHFALALGLRDSLAAAGDARIVSLSSRGHLRSPVVFGDVNPSGRLPVSWARNVGDQPFFYQYLPGTNSGSDGTNAFFFACCGFGSGGYDPVFPFGFGLSYTSFSYSNLHATDSGGRNGKIQATVDVTNTGTKAADDIVEAFAAQPVSAVLVPPKRLASFGRVHLNAGETKTVVLTFSTQNLAVVQGDIDASGPLTVEPGAYQLMVENQTANFTIP